jgi:hypothetical protein
MDKKNTKVRFSVRLDLEIGDFKINRLVRLIGDITLLYLAINSN